MKKYFILGAAIVIFGLLINYTLGGFADIEPKLVSVGNYTIYGTAFEGSYKSSGLTDLVESMKKRQQDFNGEADVVIINYFNEEKERIGMVNNFVGLRFNRTEPDSVEGLEKRVIEAKNALRTEIKIKPLVMPTPEKIQKKTMSIAELEHLHLLNLSIEQYNDSGVLIVEFPVEKQ